jgi:putative DNA primase/helicase
MGWHVFPCHSITGGKCTCGNATCPNPGKHPRTSNGVHGATNDIDAIGAMHAQWPDSNWALACGRISDIVAIDIDAGKGGYAAIDEYELARREGPLPKTLIAITGGGGRHFLFKYPVDGQPIGNRVNWLTGVDVRSDGGYIILPDAKHISGGIYAWSNWNTMAGRQEVLPIDVAFDIRSSSQQASSSFADTIKDASSILDGVPEGQRDDTLFRWACRLRRQHATDADGGRAVVTALVLQAARKSGFPENEAMRKVEQAFKQNHVDDPEDWAITIAVTGKDGDTERNEVLEHLTDIGNRNRFIALHGNNLRYVTEIGWMAWTEQGWSRTTIEYVGKLTEAVPPLIRQEAAAIADVTIKAKWKLYSMVTEGAGKLAAIEHLARSSPVVMRRANEFDADPNILACKNGIVDLKTGSIRSYEREDLVTKNTGVIYDPDAHRPEWEQFLMTTTQGDTDLIEYLQMAAGYTLTGLNTEECFMLLNGPQASGKSTWIDAINTAMGTYAAAVQSETFMFRRGRDTPQNEIARLAGVRLAAMSEIREGDYFNEALIKQVTGGDKVAARFLYKDTFEFTPQFTLWFATNHDPISTDAAMLRRIKRIRFMHTIPVAQRDPNLKALLKNVEIGSPAVLNWMVQGAVKYYALGGLKQPLSVSEAVVNYQMDQDIISLFIGERIIRDPGAWAFMTDIFRTWRDWCATMNENPGKLPTFRAKLIEMGFIRKVDIATKREYYMGVKLQTTMEAMASGWS